jgi:hypothetical protein
MKAASFALALILAGCGGGGDGGEKTHMVPVVVRNALSSGYAHRIFQLWYKTCLSRWDHEMNQMDYYVGSSGSWIPIDLPWWDPPVGNPLPAGAMLWPGDEVFVGEIPEGHYKFVWCMEQTAVGDCPGCEDLCPDGFAAMHCHEILGQDEVTVEVRF